MRFVDVDEDARVAEGTAAAVALDGALLDPVDGLLVDELDGCHRARLYRCSISHCFFSRMSFIQSISRVRPEISNTSIPPLLSNFGRAV